MSIAVGDSDDPQAVRFILGPQECDRLLALIGSDKGVKASRYALDFLKTQARGVADPSMKKRIEEELRKIAGKRYKYLDFYAPRNSKKPGPPEFKVRLVTFT